MTASTTEGAGVARRLASMLYESLLLLGVLGLTFVVPYILVGMIWHVSMPGSMEWAHIFLVLGMYFVWFWRRGGQTLAMQTWRIRLIDAQTGGTVPLRSALLRYALAWPSLFFFGAGLLWAFFDRDGQFLHDRLAGTRVVFVPPTTAVKR